MTTATSHDKTRENCGLSHETLRGLCNPHLSGQVTDLIAASRELKKASIASPPDKRTKHGWGIGDVEIGQPY